MRHEKLVPEGIKRRVQILLDARKINLAVFHRGMVAVHKHGSTRYQEKKKGNAFRRQLGPRLLKVGKRM
jgi:hypothetical protein